MTAPWKERDYWGRACREPISALFAGSTAAAAGAGSAAAIGGGSITFAEAAAAGSAGLAAVAPAATTAAFTLPSLSSVALGLSALGAVMTASSLYEQGQAGARSAEYNAALMQRNAEIARQQTQLDLEQHQRDRVRQFGAIRAAVGASGVALEGSPLDILESAAIEAERDKQMIEYKGSLRAMGYYDNAAIERIAGSAAATRGVSSATAALLSGGGQVAKQGYELYKG